MEATTILSVAFVVTLTFIWKIVNWAYLKPKQLERYLKEQGFKVNSYKLLHGDTKKMKTMIIEEKSKIMDVSCDDTMPHVQPYHHSRLKLHGGNCCIWFGPIPRILVSDPKLVKEILFNNEGYQKVQRSPLIKILLTGLLGYEGKEWAMHRNLLNPTFNLENLKYMVSTMKLSCSELVNKWEALVSPKGSCEVDVWPFLCNLTGDVISRTAFGSNYEEGKKIFQLQKEQVGIILECARGFYIPGSRFLPTKTNRRLKAIHSELGALLRAIIDNKEKTMKLGRGTNDLLGILLKTISGEEAKEKEGKINLRMTIEEVIEHCKNFYLAGQETISSLLVWTMFLLSRHQKWQNLAREEVLAVFRDDKLDFDRLNQLKTMTMIINEVLRLYPPTVMTIRRTVEKVKLGDKVLPPGVELELSFISIHHNSDIWGQDAKEFKPERFSEGMTKAAKIQGAFFPFSGGPRICIGQNFALMEAKIALTMILQRFSFELSPSYKHDPTFILTIQPQQGAHLILKKI